MNTDARFCSHCGRPIAQTAWSAFCCGPRGPLTRPLYGRMIGGVCAGIAQAYDWDVSIVRLVTVVLFFAGCGSLLIAYIAAWVILPQAPLVYAPVNYTPGTGGSAPIS